MGHDEGSVSENGGQGARETTHMLDWRRTSKDPFADQWEQILSWIQVNPTRSSGDIFRELQSLFPGRYQPLHIRSLQRGMRRTRAHVLEMGEGLRQKEVIHGDLLSPVELHQAKSVPEGLCASPLSSLLPGRLTPLQAKRAGPSLPITRRQKISQCTPR